MHHFQRSRDEEFRRQTQGAERAQAGHLGGALHARTLGRSGPLSPRPKGCRRTGPAVACSLEPLGRACRESSDRLRRSLCTRLRIGRTGERPELRRAERSGVANEPARAVVLPDELSAGDAPAQPLTAQYRLRAELGPRAGGPPPCTCPASSRMPASVSTATLFDTLDRRAQPLPRSAERIQLLRLPDEFARRRQRDHHRGRRDALPQPVAGVDRRRRRAGAAVRRAAAGRGDRPAIVATVMGCLCAVRAVVVGAPAGAVVVGYFWRRAQLALHSAWTVLPALLQRRIWASGGHR